MVELFAYEQRGEEATGGVVFVVEDPAQEALAEEELVLGLVDEDVFEDGDADFGREGEKIERLSAFGTRLVHGCRR